MYHGFYKSKQVLQQVYLCGNKSSSMSNEKSKSLDNINDILIVRKIEKEPARETCEREFEDFWDSEFVCRSDGEEKKLLAEEHEAIVKKQLQMLQADERGKQALTAEIAAIKEKQRKRAAALKNRQRALDIEKERSKKIASLPPPLPKSVKSLLKKRDDETLKTGCNKPDVQMPEELKATHIEPILIDSEENKENVMDPEEKEAKEKIQKERSFKAKKRFNTALKMDRQKEEYANIMRQIQDAELRNRREMAKRIPSDKVTVPCPISDKFQTVKKQTNMEEAAEKLFKKGCSKEHVIEEIEGYQDHYETRYGKIDSEYEAKMIDCVPSFVKENYEYLLEEESREFQGGKNFSGLDDSQSDILNQAYIETPPAADELDAGKKIDIAIDQLDKLRTELQAEYDLTVKPLLVAATESTKYEVSDKAIETDAVKLHFEDKAVEADILKIPTEVKAVETEISQYISPLTTPGMFYKPKYQGPFLQSYQNFIVPDMHQRDVHYTLPTVSSAEESGTVSWSTSSYCSLPSKHGVLTLHGSSQCAKCDICMAETENISGKDILLTKHPKSSSVDTVVQKVSKTDDSIPSGKTASVEKSSLSKYVKLLAEKYMEPKQSEVKISPKEYNMRHHSDSSPSSSSAAVPPAFVKQKICKSSIGSFSSDSQVSTKSPSSPEKVVTVESSSSMEPAFNKLSNTEKKSSYDVDDESRKKGTEFDDVFQMNLPQKNYSEVMNSNNLAIPIEYSEYDAEVKRIQAIRQIMSRRIQSNFTHSPRGANINTNDAQPESVPSTSAYVIKKGIVVQPHIYHELSTIQEMDSALTAGSLQVSKTSISPEKLSTKPSENVPSEELKEEIGHSGENLKIVSLLDPPDSEISELAKSIHFVAGTYEKKTESLEVQQPSAESVDGMSSKDIVSTPSLSMPSSESSLSTISNAKIFSSTLAKKQGQSSFLKDAKILPEYFKDVSDLQYAETSNSDSSVKSHIPSAFTLSGPISPLSSSSHSVKSVVEIKMKDAKEDKSETLVPGYIKEKIMSSSSSDIFQPMTPHSDLSSPYSHSNKYTLDVRDTQLPAQRKVTPHDHPDIYRPSANNDAFRALSTCSNVSSPDQYGMFTPHSEQEKKSFKAMTPHSDISSPGEPLFFTPRHQDYATNVESFKPLTPQSISPSVISEDFHLKQKNISSTNTNFFPMTLRFEASTSESASSEDANKKTPVKKLPQISCHVNIKAQTLNSNRRPQSPKVPQKEVHSNSSNISVRKRLAYSDKASSNEVQIKDRASDEIRAVQKVYPCSSNFFIPQTSVDTPALEKNRSDELKEGTICKEVKASTTELETFSKPSAAYSSISSITCSSYSKKFKDTKYSSTESSSSTERDMAGSYQQQHILSSKVAGGLRKQYTSLQAVSTGSSSENLSDIFSGSKIAYQSTPIKSFEEIIQEPGIMEEPDLTLMTTKYACKPETPEKPRDVSCASSTNLVAYNPVKANDFTLESSNNECKTPSLQSPQFLGSADTPSMLSFLRHEKSCMEEENSETPKNPGTASGTPTTKESWKDAHKHRKIPKDGYKQRTKRLWNNLEEVRKRNLTEERKKFSAANRLKAKEFAKKLTPKRKDK